MTISLISTGKHFELYEKARYFFTKKGLTYKWNGPYTPEHTINFNLPLTNSDKGFS